MKSSDACKTDLLTLPFSEKLVQVYQKKLNAFLIYKFSNLSVSQFSIFTASLTFKSMDYDANYLQQNKMFIHFKEF